MILIPFRRLPACRRKTAGLNLTELAIVLAITGLILGGIWVVGGQVYTNNQVRMAVEELVTISHNIRTIFAEQGGVTGSSASAINQALDQMQVFPLDMRQGSTPTGVISNPWSSGASVLVAADDCAGTETAVTPQPCFGVKFLNVPQAACVKLLVQTAQTAMGLQQVQVNSIVQGDETAGTLPLSASTAAAACAGTNIILWVYLLKETK